MKQYLVKYEADCNDEFNVYGLAILDENDKQYFESLIDAVFPLTHYVGTNEFIEYTSKINLLNDYEWIEVNELEANLLISLIGIEYGDFYYPDVEVE